MTEKYRGVRRSSERFCRLTVDLSILFMEKLRNIQKTHTEGEGFLTRRPGSLSACAGLGTSPPTSWSGSAQGRNEVFKENGAKSPYGKRYERSNFDDLKNADIEAELPLASRARCVRAGGDAHAGQYGGRIRKSGRSRAGARASPYLAVLVMCRGSFAQATRITHAYRRASRLTARDVWAVYLRSRYVPGCSPAGRPAAHAGAPQSQDRVRPQAFGNGLLILAKSRNSTPLVGPAARLVEGRRPPLGITLSFTFLGYMLQTFSASRPFLLRPFILLLRHCDAFLTNFTAAEFHAARAGAGGGEMLGARLKSWMEAQLGRARRRKQKAPRPLAPPPPPQGTPLPPPHLSSPESAYSTGYSTDGTSPGGVAPPEPAALTAPLVAPPPPPAPPTTHLYHEPTKHTRFAPCKMADPSARFQTDILVLGSIVRSDRKRRGSVEPRRSAQEVVCATPSPRPRCRIRTNPWLGCTSPSARRRAPPAHHLPPPALCHQQQTKPPPLLHAPYSIDSHPSRCVSRSPCYRGGASSDEECRAGRGRGRETAILSDADADSEGDTGLDGGDEDEPDQTASPGRRRARRRRPPRRPPRSAGATPPRARRQRYTTAPTMRERDTTRERDPLIEADREAERKYRELIREAEKLLVSVSRAPLEPPHNPRIRELRATEIEAPRRSPERTHITNFIRANSPEPARRWSPVARRSPLAAPTPPPIAVALPRRALTLAPPAQLLPSPTDRPHSEPPKRKAYARDEVLQTLEGLRRSLQQQSASLAVQRTRLDSL
ncbi:hypothetical protein EVAR_51342_1 [Eumeta japonica]|uniref:Uncharacterized protein n=1 Tax=Eumeta variegata TaxID=151549 RepID=A0A4C1XX13_EUMVA|nr:hypothetical protein EVAR_51342_1 [Eumeta japonica]